MFRHAQRRAGASAAGGGALGRVVGGEPPAFPLGEHVAAMRLTAATRPLPPCHRIIGVVPRPEGRQFLVGLRIVIGGVKPPTGPHLADDALEPRAHRVDVSRVDRSPGIQRARLPVTAVLGRLSQVQPTHRMKPAEVRKQVTAGRQHILETLDVRRSAP